jgi:hypothetical protein
MARSEDGRKLPTVPVSLRLTEAERARLQQEAGTRTLSAHIRQRLLSDDADRRRQVRLPTTDTRLLASVLAQLGQSRIAESLRELADAARVGALPNDGESETAIRSACAAVHQMRADLIRALGLVERDRHK